MFTDVFNRFICLTTNVQFIFVYSGNMLNINSSEFVLYIHSIQLLVRFEKKTIKKKNVIQSSRVKIKYSKSYELMLMLINVIAPDGCTFRQLMLFIVD